MREGLRKIPDQTFLAGIDSSDNRPTSLRKSSKTLEQLFCISLRPSRIQASASQKLQARNAPSRVANRLDVAGMVPPQKAVDDKFRSIAIDVCRTLGPWVADPIAGVSNRLASSSLLP